jgi:hypothetical protein
MRPRPGHHMHISACGIRGELIVVSIAQAVRQPKHSNDGKLRPSSRALVVAFARWQPPEFLAG